MRRIKCTVFVLLFCLLLNLAGCAAAFYIGYIDIHQVLMTKGNNNELPMTRWY